MGKIIYLDNAATYPVYPEVISLMGKIEKENFGNPGSQHILGEKASELMHKAREKIAEEVNAKSNEIIFTSGATESINLALQGINLKKNKIVISSFEHPAVYETCQFLKKKGYEIVEIPVDRDGIIDLEELEKNLEENCLFSIIHGHNEIGVLQDIKKIAKICKDKKALLHIDACQTFGKEKIDVSWGIDLLSASAHKIGGPKGIGFLYVKTGLNIKPLIFGGGQERGLRSGTENLAGIVGFAKALEIHKKIKKEKLKKLRDYCISGIEEVGGKINGSKETRLFNNIHLSLPVDAENVLSYLSLHGIMLSARSACSSKNQKENRILSAIGISENEIRGSMRIVINEFTKKEDIDYLLREIRKALDIFKSKI